MIMHELGRPVEEVVPPVKPRRVSGIAPQVRQALGMQEQAQMPLSDRIAPAIAPPARNGCTSGEVKTPPCQTQPARQTSEATPPCTSQPAQPVAAVPTSQPADAPAKGDWTGEVKTPAVQAEISQGPETEGSDGL
jgi:hypothetical protein